MQTDPEQRQVSADEAKDGPSAAPAGRGSWEAFLWAGALGLSAHLGELWLGDRLFTGMAILQLLLGSLSCTAIAVALLALVRGLQGCALLLGVHVGLMTMGASVRAWSLLLSASEVSREELARMSVYGLGFAFLVYVLIALTHRLWSPI